MRLFCLYSFIIFINIGTAVGSSVVPAQKKIFFAILSSHGSPFVDVTRKNSREEVTGGLFMRVGRALAKELGADVEFILIPPARVQDALLAGRVDMICHMTPGWLQPSAANLDWTTDYLYESNNVIGYLQGQSVKSLTELKGRKIAAIYAFHYKDYDPLFEKKELNREDGPSTESNVQKLLKDRVHFVLFSKIEYDFYKKKYSDLRFFDSGLEKVQTRCALSRKSVIKINDLNAAVKTLKDREFFTKKLFERP